MTTAPLTPPSPAPRTPARRRRRLLVALTTLLVLLVGYTAWSNLRPVHLTASIDIEASPEDVWHVLTDLPAYGQWNPFITSAEVTSPGGRLEEGAHLRIVLHDRTGDTTFTPRVLTADPGRELRWLGRIGPGWIADGEHRFTIEQTAPGHVRLTQSERFTGIAVPFAHSTLDTNTLPQFHALNKALALRAEALSP
ncbi:SRPBCC domain-containing protein [Streptomyces sp. NPDC004787]|uniref:SRPBCC domain-containing protein n=1 Tax=Streptomyces sp. NPDC004787 TaxID=3154291 RepID=UPI0033A02D1E